jgi:hypothetical protein
MSGLEEQAAQAPADGGIVMRDEDRQSGLDFVHDRLQGCSAGRARAMPNRALRLGRVNFRATPAGVIDRRTSSVLSDRVTAAAP